MPTTAHRRCVFLRFPTPIAEALSGVLRVRRHGVRKGQPRRRRVAAAAGPLQGMDGAVGAAETRAQGTRLLEAVNYGVEKNMKQEARIDVMSENPL